MARGQAFETMMLVISVIVALAILGVLLNILGVFNQGGIGGDPLPTIRDNLRDLQSKGFGSSIPKKVTFSDGQVIRRTEFTTDLPISPAAIRIFCADGADAVCGGDSNAPLKITDEKTISSNARYAAMMVTCANDPDYCVVFAGTSQPDAASEKCAVECKLDE